MSARLAPLLLATVALVACASPTSPPVTAPPAATAATAAPPPPAAPSATEGPPVTARRVAPAELAGDPSCGPFRSSELAAAPQPLLADRVRVRFFPNGTPAGAEESGKIEIARGSATLFVGARETFMRADEQFVAKASKVATFRGTYEPIAMDGATSDVNIVAGVVVTPAPGDMVAIAHGWFPDAERSVIDVAVFVSRSALADMPACRLFALKLLSTVASGARKLGPGGSGDVETQVSYARFRYRLPAGWWMTKSVGIHDFARIHFRKSGAFPAESTDLQLALDSHPGDWGSPGAETGQRPGMLLGLPVAWHLTSESSAHPTFGAWTVSKDVVSRDHSVASISAGSTSDRDEAITFAESVRVGR